MAWRKVKVEVEQQCAYLEEEVPTILSCDTAGLGEGRTDGSSRTEMVKEVERLRAACLDKAMKQLPDQTTRAVPLLLVRQCRALRITEASNPVHRKS